MTISDLSPENIQKIQGGSGNIAEVTTEGELKISSFANVSFVDGNMTATTTELLANVSGTNLSNRKTLVIFNRGAQDIYYGTSGVDDIVGIPIVKDEVISLSVGESVNIYIITKSGTSTVTIQEFA